jgi:hypothetical protein
LKNLYILYELTQKQEEAKSEEAGEKNIVLLIKILYF